MSAADGLQHISHDGSQGLYYDPQSKVLEGPELLVAGSVKDRQEGRICGLQRKWFCIFVGVIVVLVAAAIGGGVGGAMAGKTQTCPSISSNCTKNPDDSIGSTPSPTSSSSIPPTNTAIFTPPTTPSEALLKTGCPSANQTTFEPVKSKQNQYPLNQPFQKFCDLDLFLSGTNAYSDIFSYQANNSSLNGCIDSCVQYNIDWDEDDRIRTGPCMAVVFTAMVPSQKARNMRCYLKTNIFGTLTLYKHSPAAGDVYASAKMTSFDVIGQ